MESRWPQRAQAILSGDVLSVRLDVTWADDGPFMREFWAYVDQAGGELRHDIAAAVKQHLGPEFEVRSLTFARGSITVLIVIGTVYYAISRYKNFVESVEMLVSQLENTLRHFFGRPAPVKISVSGSWTPGPGLVQSGLLAARSRRHDPSLVLLWYLVISHAALLATVFWLLVSKLGP